MHFDFKEILTVTMILFVVIVPIAFALIAGINSGHP